jgi:hypothetical protein
MIRSLKLKLITAASACVLASLTAQANLVVNGGFEAGVFAPWTPANAVITAVPANVHSGTFAAQLNPIVSAITQTVPIVGGSTYSLDFWAKSDGVGVLTVTLDSVAVATIINPAAGYTHYTYSSITPTSAGDLTFLWSDGTTQHAWIDDVNLVPVPEPTTMIAGAMLLVPFGASTLRFMRKTRKA